MSRNRIIAGRAVIVVDVLDNVQKGIASIQHNLRKLSNIASTVGDQSFRTGLFGSIFSGVAIKQFATFEDSMLFLQTKLGIFGKAVGKNKQIMDEMEKTIRNLGRTTSFTSTQVAEGAATLAQGGFSYREVIDSLQAVLDLSRASRTEITSTAEALVRALRAFNIPTTMAGDIASQFVRATRAGTLELEDLTTALKYSQGTAASLSQSLPTMLALFAEMSNKGLVGSTAGTSTNTAMAQIVKKMEDIKEIFPDFQPIYGPSGFDFPRTLQYLVELSKGMNELDRKVLFQDVFNLRGERSATASIDIESVIKLKNEIASAGDEARKAAATMDQGVGGAARIAISAIQELALTIVQTVAEPIKNFLKVVQEIANIFSAISAQNPMLATMVLFSPGILLASGLAMIGIAKGLQVVATVLGGMRGLVRQVLIPMTTGGIAGIKQLGGLAGASAKGASNLRDRSSTVLNATSTIRANRAALPGLQQRYRYEKLLFQIMIRRGVATQQQLANQGRLALRAKQAVDFNLRSTRLATGARSAALSFGGIKGLLTGLNTMRKFIPSWWTILDILILFGDKIPVVSTVLSKFGAAFGAAFSEIGKIGTYASGPIALMKAAFQAFSQNQGGLGIQALQMAFKGLVMIIKNQLIAAWDIFKAKLDNVWTIIKGVGISLFTIFESVVFSVRSVIDSVTSLFSNGLGLGGSGDFGNSFINGTSSIVESVSKIVNSIPFMYAMIVEQFTSGLEQFLLKFEAVLWDVLGTIFNNEAATNAGKAVREQADMRGTVFERKIKELLTEWEKSSQKITDGFKSTTAENTASAEERNKDSQSISDYLTQQTAILQGMLKDIQNKAEADARRQAAEEARKLQEAQQQSNLFGPKAATGSAVVQMTNAIAKALVTSARDIQGNIVQYGKALDEKQLDVLEDIRDDQRRGLRQQGTILPINP